MPFRTPTSPAATGTPTAARRTAKRAALPLALTAVLIAGAAATTSTAAYAASTDRTVDGSISALLSPAGTSERTVDTDADAVLTAATDVSASAAGKVDATQLNVQIAQLRDSEDLPTVVVAAFTELLQASTTQVSEAVAAYDAEQARLQAEAQAAAEALAAANTPDGARATARTMAASSYGWGDDQFSCLNSLWNKESDWNYQAYNAGSGATGIPQSLPGSKMASAGADWQTNAATQIAWGLDYIQRAYGTPCAAWGHSQATDWY